MNIEALVLAAGKGTRMESAVLPKVMHLVSGYPIIGWIMESLSTTVSHYHVVVGHKKERIIDFLEKYYPSTTTSEQHNQNGTGGAVIDAVQNLDKSSTHILILPGDAPLIKPETIQNFVSFATDNDAELALMTTKLSDPGHYGRVKRNKDKYVTKIVEYLDASDNERKIKEINSGIYLIKKDLLIELLSKIDNDNAKSEYYLTDIIELAHKNRHKVFGYLEEDHHSLSGINNRAELAGADYVMQKRIKEKFMKSGVTLLSPTTIYIEHGASIGKDSIIYPGVFIGRKADIGSKCIIESNCSIDSHVKNLIRIKALSRID